MDFCVDNSESREKGFYLYCGRVEGARGVCKRFWFRAMFHPVPLPAHAVLQKKKKKKREERMEGWKEGRREGGRKEGGEKRKEKQKTTLKTILIWPFWMGKYLTHRAGWHCSSSSGKWVPYFSIKPGMKGRTGALQLCLLVLVAIKRALHFGYLWRCCTLTRREEWGNYWEGKWVSLGYLDR